MGRPRDDTTTEHRSTRDHGTRAAPGLAVAFENGASTLRVVEVGATPLVIGRGTAAGFFVDDNLLSRLHCAVSFELGRGWLIEDQSRHGSFVDGKLVAQSSLVVEDPHTLRIGESVLIFHPEVSLLMGAKIERRGELVVGPSLRAAEREIIAAAKAGTDLLVLGESGTGKEWAAATYRRAGGRRGQDMNINSATLPHHLFESEMFGFVRGAFSGAEKDTPGLFEAADQGTLFFDEIGELPLDLQPKLLRVLQERTVRRVGDRRERPVDVRVIAATNRDLLAEVSKGTFRADLLYRLDQARVRLPALRERPEDLPVVVEQELQRVDGPPPSAALIEEVLLRAWPGNFREIASALRAAASHARSTSSRKTDARHLPPRPSPTSVDPSAPTAEELEGSYRRTLSSADIREALRANDGNVSAAAGALGVHRHTLRRHMLKHGIPSH